MSHPVKTNSNVQSQNPVVITGAAIISSLGLTRQETWTNILAGKNGFTKLSALEIPLPDDKDGGQAVDLPGDYLPDQPREVRYLSRAIADALQDANPSWPTIPLSYPSNRIACLLGTTLHGMRSAGQFLRSNNLDFLRNFLAGDTIKQSLNSLETDQCIATGFMGTTCSACSSSLGSIAMAVTMLETNQADLVIAGGYDTISEYVYGGFNSLRLVADGPLKPFTRNRKGMKLAEGYGIVILERRSDALLRHANILANIVGWGESADAHHLTQPHPQGDGAARAIRMALKHADIQPQQVDLIAAHATGTPDNDSGEHAAFSAVFGDHLKNIAVTAFKSHLGHTLGGAGAIELILSATALQNQIIPHVANVQSDELEFAELNLITKSPQQANINISLNTSLGFGGANTCVILQKSEPTTLHTVSALPSNSTKHRVYITGVGVIAPGLIGNEAFIARLHENDATPILADTGAIADPELEALLNARRIRRMSAYVKLTLASANIALAHAGITDIPTFAADCAAILGSTHGSANFSAAYYRQIIDEGLIAANPAMFAEAVPNAGAAQLSLMLGIKGACQTIIGTRTSGVDALSLAALRIADGTWNHAIVSAGEEYSDLVNLAYTHCNLKSSPGSSTGFVTGAGAVTFILESEQSVAARNARPLALIRDGCHRSMGSARVLESLAEVISSLSANATQRPAFIGSSCNTWIDQAEAIAFRKAGVHACPSTYGMLAETFSASSFYSIAAAILASTGKYKFFANNSRAAVVTDFNGNVSGVQFDLLQPAK